MAAHRVIQDLKWAQTCPRPSVIPRHIRPRSGSIQWRGLKYEDEVGVGLGPGWTHGQWFQFVDASGMGYCQPDFFQVREDTVVIVEAKYTWVPEAHTQLADLYGPILERVFAREALLVVVCKVLTPRTPIQVHGQLSEVLEAGGGIWHFLGVQRPRRMGPWHQNRRTA